MTWRSPLERGLWAGTRWRYRCRRLTRRIRQLVPTRLGRRRAPPARAGAPIRKVFPRFAG